MYNEATEANTLDHKHAEYLIFVSAQLAFCKNLFATVWLTREIMQIHSGKKMAAWLVCVAGCKEKSKLYTTTGDSRGANKKILADTVK